jgi:hypothetical protein
MAYFSNNDRDRTVRSPSSPPSRVPELPRIQSFSSRSSSPSGGAPSSPLSAITPRPRRPPVNVARPEAPAGPNGGLQGPSQPSTGHTIQRSRSTSSVVDQPTEEPAGAEIARGIVTFLRDHFIPSDSRLPGVIKPALARQALDRWKKVQQVRSTVQEDWASTVPDDHGEIIVSHPLVSLS